LDWSDYLIGLYLMNVFRGVCDCHVPLFVEMGMMLS